MRQGTYRKAWAGPVSANLRHAHGTSGLSSSRQLFLHGNPTVLPFFEHSIVGDCIAETMPSATPIDLKRLARTGQWFLGSSGQLSRHLANVRQCRYSFSGLFSVVMEIVLGHVHGGMPHNFLDKQRTHACVDGHGDKGMAQ